MRASRAQLLLMFDSACRRFPVAAASIAVRARRLAVLLLGGALPACAPAGSSSSGGSTSITPSSGLLESPILTTQHSGTTALLQAVSAVDERIVWVSGHRGTWVRTLDGGVTWEVGRVPGADTLQFRDVHAVSADVAYLMAAGNGELSRIYKTTDGGRTWVLQHLNRDPDVFFDCMTFWEPRMGIVFGDAVRGEHYILRTVDGGATWDRVPAQRLPPALPGEGSFAASGTCSAGSGRGHAWIGTGNASPARVLRTTDAGASWAVDTTPLVSGPSAGSASIIFRDTLHGMVLGGEIDKPDGRGDYVAITSDGGRSWSLGGRVTFAGAVYGAAWIPGVAARAAVAVGPGGADVSLDGGRTWARVDTGAYWSVGFGSPRHGWAVGPRGRITRLQIFR